MAKIKQAIKWIGNNFKIFILILVIIILSILVFWWGRKNKKIRHLENQIAILNARLKIERLEIKYKKDMDDLKKLKEEDKKIDEDIAKIEKSLEKKLKPDMTADEIIAKFKEIGIR
jgi:predicted Holliday junction resolvase-like endonuclease